MLKTQKYDGVGYFDIEFTRKRIGAGVADDVISNLVFCPGCGNIQNEGEVCIKCATLIPVQQREDGANIETEIFRREKKAKVSLMARRRTKKVKSAPKETRSKTQKRTHNRKAKATS